MPATATTDPSHAAISASSSVMATRKQAGCELCECLVADVLGTKPEIRQPAPIWTSASRTKIKVRRRVRVRSFYPAPLVEPLNIAPRLITLEPEPRRLPPLARNRPDRMRAFELCWQSVLHRSKNLGGGLAALTPAAPDLIFRPPAQPAQRCPLLTCAEPMSQARVELGDRAQPFRLHRPRQQHLHEQHRDYVVAVDPPILVDLAAKV